MHAHTSQFRCYMPEKGQKNENECATSLVSLSLLGIIFLDFSLSQNLKKKSDKGAVAKKILPQTSKREQNSCLFSAHKYAQCDDS